MKRVCLIALVLVAMVFVAGCERMPRPFELFMLEFFLAVVSFFLALLVGGLARLTSKHLILKGQRVAAPDDETTAEAEGEPKTKAPSGGRDAKTSLVIALFVSFLIIGVLVAFSVIAKKRQYEIPHQENYFLPHFYMWSFHAVFSEDIYWALMLNGKIPYEGFMKLVTDVEDKRYAETEAEQERRRLAKEQLMDEDEFSDKSSLSPTEFKNLLVGLSLALTLLLLMIPAYVGARSKRGLWIVPIVFLAVNVALNVYFYRKDYYPVVREPGGRMLVPLGEEDEMEEMDDIDPMRDIQEFMDKEADLTPTDEEPPQD